MPPSPAPRLTCPRPRRRVRCRLPDTAESGAPMGDVTHLLGALDAGDAQAAGRLLALVYAELRRLAAGRLAREPAGAPLDATDLVHEAYLRLLGPAAVPRFANRRHFYAAAAEAMRRILIDAARRRGRAKRGGGRRRVDL